jgi:hypothetical protein
MKIAVKMLRKLIREEIERLVEAQLSLDALKAAAVEAGGKESREGADSAGYKFDDGTEIYVGKNDAVAFPGESGEHGAAGELLNRHAPGNVKSSVEGGKRVQRIKF